MVSFIFWIYPMAIPVIYWNYLDTKCLISIGSQEDGMWFEERSWVKNLSNGNPYDWLDTKGLVSIGSWGILTQFTEQSEVFAISEERPSTHVYTFLESKMDRIVVALSIITIIFTFCRSNGPITTHWGNFYMTVEYHPRIEGFGPKKRWIKVLRRSNPALMQTKWSVAQ